MPDEQLEAFLDILRRSSHLQEEALAAAGFLDALIRIAQRMGYKVTKSQLEWVAMEALDGVLWVGPVMTPLHLDGSTQDEADNSRY